MVAPAIGLDIGSSAVRAVQVTAGRRGPAVLERVGQVLLPRGAVREGEIADPEPVAQAVSTLWSRYAFKGSKVALGVGNQQVVVRKMDLPFMPEDELAQSLEFQVQDSIPIPVDQAILDFNTLENYESAQGERFNRVLVVAAHRQMVDSILGVVRGAKLEPTGLDLDAFAMLRSLVPEGFPGEGGEMLLDIGASVTNMVVHHDGVPHFVRILLMGGDSITSAVVDDLGVEYDEAEDLKAAVGMSEVSGLGREHDAARVITERALRFIDEIQGSLDYYRAQPDAIPVRRMVVCGGGSQLPNLRQRLAETLHMPVEHGHPMQSLKIGNVGLEAEQLVQAEPYLAVAVGLALGGMA
ncbi:MAG: type IV pilus assembly protein PilM [Nitriliruptorales bacterium]|nr:type IV pilus assembly protein PilM [Nitriliruptorales bacterium]